MLTKINFALYFTCVEIRDYKMLTKDKKITKQDLAPGAFEREVLPMPTNWYMDAVYGVLIENPGAFNKILDDRNTALLFLMWLSYGAFTSCKLPNQLKHMPDMLWESMVKHQWVDIYASGDMDNIVTKTYGMNFSIAGHTLYTTCGDFNNFSESFRRYLHKIYRLLNDKNRENFQKKMPVSDAGEFFNCNYDGYFSINEYIPTINRLNCKMDISEVLIRLFSRISVSTSVREMLKEFEEKKDPSKFPILWERLAGHPDYGNLMLELSRLVNSWFEVQALRDNTKRDYTWRQK